MKKTICIGRLLLAEENNVAEDNLIGGMALIWA